MPVIDNEKNAEGKTNCHIKSVFTTTLNGSFIECFKVNIAIVVVQIHNTL